MVVRHISGEDFNPAPFNARTRCHEYGGGAWTVADGTLYFSNFADQRLYRLRRERYGTTPVPLTPEGAWRFADGVIDARRGAGWACARTTPYPVTKLPMPLSVSS